MKARMSFLLLGIIAMVLLAACAAPAATPVPAPPPTTVSSATTAPTAAPKSGGPTVGGNLVFALDGEPETLDPQVSVSGNSATVEGFIGATLVGWDLSGKFVPYLAKTWNISPDGLTYTFTLKEGIKFQDGSPLTASDWVWTFQRAADPKFATAALVDSVASTSAPDDHTFQIKLKEAYAPFLFNLVNSRLQPMSKTWVEKQGDQIGRQPLGVGPYKLKEWQTGQKLVLERNPDFDWGPDYTHKGPYYIQTIEFRFIPEYATIIAGLETGAVDLSSVQPKDVDRLKGTNKFQVFEGLWGGLNPWVLLNVSKPPFDDVRVRQAFYHAVDRQAIIKTVANGMAVEQRGPLSAAQLLYWPGIEQYASGFDLQKAQALIAQAGYTAGSDGLLLKDGKPFNLTIKVPPDNSLVKCAQMLQQQYKALGVSIDIQQVDPAVLTASAVKGDYEFVLSRLGQKDPDLYYLFYDSKTIGTLNRARVKDPDLDKLLEASRTAVDTTKRGEIFQQVAKYMVDKAYVIPIYTPKLFFFMNNRIQGAALRAHSGDIANVDLADAYVVSSQ